MNNTQETHLKQLSIRIPEINNTGWIQDTNGTGTTRLPYQECSRGGHQVFQGSLPECPCRYSTGFTPSLWDRLLSQAEISINLLRQSNATLNVSDYEHLSRQFDYNKMMLSPMVMSVQVHENTDNRGTWAYHLVRSWYLATLPEHYITQWCHIKANS